MEAAKGDEQLRDAIMRSILGDNTSNKSSNINIVGADRWQLSACLLLTAVSALTAGAALWFAKDARDEMRSQVADAKAEVRAERLSREIMNKWTAQEVTAIRSYITTGKLAPMGPPPTTTEQEKTP